MLRFPAVGVIHVSLTTVFGLWLILKSNKYETAAYVGSYIMGAEVLWRMTKAPVLWEMGKYAASALFLIALLRHGSRNFSRLPVIYFMLLLPAVLLVFANLGFDESRSQVSFNMSGPLALMASAVYFSQLKITKEKYSRILLVMIIPVGGIGALTLYSILTTGTVFRNASNLTTSGGFGPNQVSSILGLASLVTFWYLLLGTARFFFRALLFSLMFLFAGGSALTFSRGGLVLAVSAGLIASLFLFTDSRARLKFVFIVSLCLVGTYYILIPWLDDYTSGAIVSRFGNSSVTGRDNMIMVDLKVWWDNPFFGVGPGMGHYYYESLLDLRGVPAHTEFSRMLAEHGLFGLLSLLLLTFMAIDNFRRSDPQHRALIIGASSWGLLYMSGNAMRLLAPAFIYGIAFTTIVKHSYVPRLSIKKAVSKHPHYPRLADLSTQGVLVVSKLDSAR